MQVFKLQRNGSDFERKMLTKLLVGILMVVWTGFPPWLAYIVSAQERHSATQHPPTQAYERVEEIGRALELEQQQRHKNGPKTYTLSEGDINSYISYKMQQQPIRGMRSLQIHMHGANHLTALAVIDSSQITLGREGIIAASVRSVLTHDLYLRIDGLLNSSQHKGQFVIDYAEINGITVPNSLVRAVLRQIGEKQHPPLDVTQPFPLPLDIERVEITPGALRIIT